MSEVAKFEPKVPAQSGQSRRLNVSAVMGKFLAPFAKTEEISGLIRLANSAKVEALRTYDDGRPSYARSVLAKGGAAGARMRGEIEALNEELPSRARIAEWRAAFGEALTKPATEPEMRLLTGLLLDGHRNRPTDATPVLIEVFLFALGEGIEVDDSPVAISATVLAGAVRAAWRTNVFAPSVSQLLELCAERFKLLRARRTFGNVLAGARIEVDAILADIDALMGPPAPAPHQAPGPDDIPF